MEEIVYKQIELFLSGQMSQEAAIQFEKLIEENDALKSEVALYKAINLHFGEQELNEVSSTSYKEKLRMYRMSAEGKADEERLLKIRTSYHNKSTEETTQTSKNKVIYFIVSAAAIVVFALGIFMFQGEMSNQDLYASYYSSKELPSFTDRSSAESSTLQLAIANFNDAKYAASLEYFNQYIKAQENVNPLVYIYTGLIASENENLEEAINQFEMLENLPIEDSSRALWYKALIYLKFEKASKAREILTKIVADSSNYKYKEAKELLTKL